MKMVDCRRGGRVVEEEACAWQGGGLCAEWGQQSPVSGCSRGIRQPQTALSAQGRGQAPAVSGRCSRQLFVDLLTALGLGNGVHTEPCLGYRLCRVGLGVSGFALWVVGLSAVTGDPGLGRDRLSASPCGALGSPCTSLWTSVSSSQLPKHKTYDVAPYPPQGVKTPFAC